MKEIKQNFLFVYLHSRIHLFIVIKTKRKKSRVQSNQDGKNYKIKFKMTNDNETTYNKPMN